MPDASLITLEGEELKELDRAWRADRHYLASFQPQSWINDYAVDCDAEGPRAWEVTQFISQCGGSEGLRSAMLKNNSDDSDSLRSDPAAPQWVRDYSGPFTVSVYAYVDAPSTQVALDAINGVAPAHVPPARRPGM